MKLARRKILYTEMANGKVTINPNPRDGLYDVNDKISAGIVPDKGYMVGLIYIKEENTCNPIKYEVTNYSAIRNMVINFSMPNDNVKLSVKFVKDFSGI